jgi:hypothetical protein
MIIRIFGNGLDALLMAYSLTQDRRTFEWVTTVDQPGGFFSGSKNCAGQPIDIGMVLLEPNNFGVKQIPLSRFSGEEGHAARPYINEAYSLLHEFFGQCRSVQITTMDTNGKQVPDYFIQDSLTSFRGIETGIQEQLVSSIRWLEDHQDWHPRNKLVREGILSKVDVATYFRRIYGEKFYRDFFAGYVGSLLGSKAENLPANLHRRAWLPLYWPETLLSYISNEPNSFELFQPSFMRPRSGSIAKWVNDMFLFVLTKGFGAITKVENIYPERYENFKSVSDFAFLNHSIFKNKSQRHNEVNPEHYVDLRVVHFCTDQFEDKVVFLNHDKNGAFRISTETTSDSTIGGITFEFGSSSVLMDDDRLLSIALGMCQKLSVEPRCTGKLFKGRLALRQISGIEPARETKESGNPSTFFSEAGTSINDNIVRGAYASSLMREGEV